MRSTIPTPHAVQHAEESMVADWLTGVIAAVGGSTDDLRVRFTPLATRELIVGQANATVHGLTYRVQAPAHTREEVGILLVGQLAQRLAEPGPRTTVSEPPARHGPPRILRRKNTALEHLTVTQAVQAGHRLAYHAHLFTERETGYDTAVFNDQTATGTTGAPLVTDVRAAPQFTIASALARAARTGTPLLFFAELPTRRGALLYARYAGGYGLVRSTDER